MSNESSDAAKFRMHDIVSLEWREYVGNPLIEPPFPSPIIADPTFLPPSSSPDQCWHLYAHSLIGIHHFVSTDGIAWAKQKELVSPLSLRAFVFEQTSRYYLFYEKILQIVPRYHSRIEARVSSDLYSWSEPTIILEPFLRWHRAGGHIGNVGNPCMIVTQSEYRLYYSAGLVSLKEWPLVEPKYIGCATSKELLSAYSILPDPLMSPDPSDSLMNLGAGSIKVLEAEDGFVGFQNGIYSDLSTSKSGSAIRLLTSNDGYVWLPAQQEPILKPSKGWKRSFVYACDVRAVGSEWILYFNARDGWSWGSERIGRATGVKS